MRAAILTVAAFILFNEPAGPIAPGGEGSRRIRGTLWPLGS